MLKLTSNRFTQQRLAQRLLSSPKLTPPTLTPYLLQLQQCSRHDFSDLIEVSNNLLTFMNGDIHHNVKKVLANCFSAAAIQAQQQTLQGIVSDLVARLSAQANDRESDEALDAIEHIETPLFIAIVEQIFGLNITDKQQFMDDAVLAVRVSEPMQSIKVLLGIKSAFSRMILQIETQLNDLGKASKEPTTLIYRLASLLSEPALNIGSRQIAIIVSTLIFASRTTTETLTNILIENSALTDAQRKQFQSEQWVKENVDQMVRFCASTKFLTRSASEAIAVDGCPFAKDQNIIVDIPAANRDATYYENCDYAQLADFKAKRHLAFGAGVHRCPGESLALNVLSISLPIIYRAFPDLHVDGKSAQYGVSKMAQRITSVPLRV